MEKTKRAGVKEDVARGYYEFREFRKHKVIAAFSGRRFRMNFVDGERPSLTIASRRLFCRLAGVSFQNLVCLEQVHGANIIRVGKQDAGRGTRSLKDQLSGTDAALTNEPKLVLSVRTADCGPLFFLDPVRRVIGIAHVGWRGAAARLTSKMVQAFRMQFLSRPEDLLVAMGPMIRSCCYQVGSEFQSAFGSLVTQREEGLYFDLAGWIKQELEVSGVKAVSIFDSGFCTSCLNHRFPSYRKEGPNVRPLLSMISFI